MIASQLGQNTVGRPTVVTPEVVTKLVSILQRGLSITKACSYARIDRTSFYRKYNNDIAFRNKIDDARNFATIVAAEIVVDDIVKHKNVQTAKWYLERKDPEEFSQKAQVVVDKTEKHEYVFMTDSEVKQMADTLHLEQIDPSELLDAIESDNDQDFLALMEKAQHIYEQNQPQTDTNPVKV